MWKKLWLKWNTLIIKQMNKNITKKELVDALSNMVTQADEDTPQSYRSEHFINALDEAKEILKQMGKIS